MKTNTLYYGDCLDWMRKWPSASVDLIYLDPPFNSKRDYSVFFSRGNPKEKAQFEAFTDTWYWDEPAVTRYDAIAAAAANPARDCIVGLQKIIGDCGMLAYLTYMAERLVEMRRLLKETGGIYLHCDPTASHYLKVLMDGVFGAKRFRNEIVWCYSRPSAPGQKQLSRVHDIILHFTAGDEWTFNADAIRQPYAESSRNREGYAANVSKVAVGSVELHAEGKFPQDWIEIPALKGNAKEYLGYPTQKPIALLRRIVAASSNKNDIVLDPFCGCGTTIDAAQKLGRQWVGIDISSFAVSLIKNRRLKNSRIQTEGIPFDMAGAEKMATEQPLQFEAWAIELLQWFAPNKRHVGDGGIDGQGIIVAEDGGVAQTAIAQVKGGRFHLSQLRDFAHVIKRQKAAFGVYITLNKVATKAARAEAAGLGQVAIGRGEFPVLQLWSIEDYFDDRPPKLPLMFDPYTGKPDIQGDLNL